ncbi:putative short-chain type dehydrogenase [Lasiosphaeria ovina]|uniref:Short-chain type dehydrogenase n=1 Tax=Lasiosphaeria ovina TaxID=92902 RepID=A0AAE0JU87_9PEZI|nr:putative short-chain type dehydrogenase [Lasiosphaeria ovina]
MATLRISNAISRAPLGPRRFHNPLPRRWQQPPLNGPSVALFSTSSPPQTSPADTPRKPCRHLRGKVAVVTGAGSQGEHIGNGRATALLLAEDGAAVVCVDKQLSLAERTVAMISSANNTDNSNNTDSTGRQHAAAAAAAALAVEADVTREQDCQRVIAAALAAYGRVDILVNVVGVLGARGTAVDVEVAAWAAGLHANVTSMMLMARCAIPAMLANKSAQGCRGSIVNIGSVAGLRGGTPNNLVYPTSKGAVVNMTRAMAAHHGRDGIRVNCVCPGMLYTPMMMHASDGKLMSSEMREARRRRSLLQTEGDAWDCASAVRFLAGDEARWITGAVLPVDAGATAATAVSMDS